MDRDKRWERVKFAYDVLVKNVGEQSEDIFKSIEHSYTTNNVTDEFIKPIINLKCSNKGIQDGDAVICFNFRTDRCREITNVLTQEDHIDFAMKKLNLHYTTMTDFDKTFKEVHVIFENDNLNNTLGEVLALNKKKQIRIAETEKYPHVTFFLVVAGKKNLKEKNE